MMWWRTRAGFLTERLTSKSPHAPLGGIENGGYKLVYTDQPNDITQARITLGVTEEWWSIGINVSNDGHIEEMVLLGSAADQAKLGPGPSRGSSR